MILYILLAVLFTSSLFVILKMFAVWNVNSLQGLTLNYITASLFAFCVGFQNNVEHIAELKEISKISFVLGALFITGFYLTMHTAQTNGVSVASIASKMSVVIPTLSGVWLYGEPFTILKITGLALALFSVYLTGSNDKSDGANKSHSLIFPLLVFICCGIIDTSLKYTQAEFFTPENSQLFASAFYGCAGIFGVIIVTYQIFFRKEKLSARSIAAGIFLGLCNYPSLHFLFLALKYPGADSGKVFTIINVAVVVCCVIVSYFIFNEKIKTKKLTGIALAITAIILLYFA